MLLGAAMLTPAFAGGGVTKKFVKKTAKKIAASGDTAVKGELQAQIDALKGTTPDKVIHFGPLALTAGAAPQQVAVVGPFTFTARCDDAGGGNVVSAVTIATSQNDGFLDGTAVDPDFDPSDGPLGWAGLLTPGSSGSHSPGQSAVYDAARTTKIWGWTMVTRKQGGVDCTIAGLLNVDQP